MMFFCFFSFKATSIANKNMFFDVLPFASWLGCQTHACKVEPFNGALKNERQTHYDILLSCQPNNTVCLD